MNYQRSKEFWIAFLVNFFFPGGGHIYAGDTERGVLLLIFYLLSCALIPALYFTAAPALGIWIYALATSKKVVDEYEDKVETQKKEIVEHEKQFINTQEFIENLNKANQLFLAEIINAKEFEARKNSIINELTYKKLKDEPDNLLLSLVTLKQSGVLSTSDVQLIKRNILQ